MDKLYIVVPCYNEEAVLHETTKRLTDKLNRMVEAGLAAQDSRIMYVNDGSKDRTWEIIEELHRENPYVLGVKLSRNRGHQNALLAGLMTAKDMCDVTISMDADLQDDIEVLDVRDYIASPKENGYRSLHLIVSVPVYYSDQKHLQRVEVQIRTIAMDFWASLEHQLKYKKEIANAAEISAELKACADQITCLDVRMQSIRHKLTGEGDRQ